MAKKTFLFCLLSAASFFLASSTVQADQVRDYERLRLLQQATGETPSGNNSFETRLNALLDVSTNTSPAYQTQAAEDTRESQAEQKKIAEAAAIEAKYLERTRALNQPSPEKTQTGPVPIKSEDARDTKNYVDASEDTFQRLVREEADKKKQYEELKKQEKDKVKTLEDAVADRPKIAPSLANNPFYVQGASTVAKNQEDFDSRKALIVSRLVQNGYSNFRAEQLVSEASTPEEMVLVIMNEGQTYGEATEIVSAES